MTEQDVDIDIDVEIDIDGDDSDPEQVKAPSIAGPAISRPLLDVDMAPIGIESTRDRNNQHENKQGSPKDETLQGTYIDSEASLADEYQIPDFSQDFPPQSRGPQDPDKKSQELIDKMLAEEKFYLGQMSGMTSSSNFHQDNEAQLSGSTFEGSSSYIWQKEQEGPSKPYKIFGHKSKKRKSSEDRSGSTKRSTSEDSRLNAKLSSADLPSHNTRWTNEEDDRLRQGITDHGYGNWKAIAAVVGTRNPLQVKNHARHLAASDRVPRDASAHTSDGEVVDRGAISGANSAEEDHDDGLESLRRQPRSKKVKHIEASASNESVFEPFGRRGRRARSATSESGNDEFTGSEFGATSGYDTDNDEDRSASKSPSLTAKIGYIRHRSSSVGQTTPSPGLRPIYSAMASPFSISSQGAGISDVLDDEDMDINIESSDDDSSTRLDLVRNRHPFTHKSASRSISPFSNASSRSRLSSEFDSDSDREDGGGEPKGVRRRSLGPSTSLSDTLALSTDPYSNAAFNTSGSSINSAGTGTGYKPSLKDAHYLQQQQLLLQKGGQLSHLTLERIANSPKERRTVSFGAVHVAELQPDVNSYDEEDIHSSEDGEVNSGTTGISILARSRCSNPPVLSSSMDTLRSTSLELGTSPWQSNTVLPLPGQRSRPDSKLHRPINEDHDEEEGSLGTGPRMPSASIFPTGPTHKVQKRGVTRSPPSHITGQPRHGAGAPLKHQPLAHLLHTSSPRQLEAHTESSKARPSEMARILDKSVITDEEKIVHSEFFCNKASKTPERYQRIRNTILSAWERSPSTYLTKTSVRSGLKDCGDVNAIGRVHSWLESIGAINVGMTASSPGASLARPRNGGNNSSKRRGHSEERGWSSSSSSSAPVVHHRKHAFEDIDDLDSTLIPGIRRRRVRNEKGEWVDERELEGHVIEHNVHSKDGKRSKREELDDDHLDDAAFFERHGMTKEEMEEECDQERLAAQNAKYFAATEVLPVNTRVPKNRRAQHFLRQTRGFYEFDEDEGPVTSIRGYDPFRLISLRKYNQQNPAPFRVKVSSDAMLIMDFHSHLAETEVIGLLGGLFDEDEKILFILGVFPCRSISTGLQCEMDPASDVEARSFFSSKGFVVVGWYHSHPTFEPNPSIRDIENQSDHQHMFRRHETGVEPFVGVIVSPYDPRNLSFSSKFQFLSVSEQIDDRQNCRIPFGYDREITRTNELSVLVFQQLSDLVRYYRTYEYQVDLSKPLRKGETTTRLEKLLKSMVKHIFVGESQAQAFLKKVEELVIKGFDLNISQPDRAPPTASVRQQALAHVKTPPGGDSHPDGSPPSVWMTTSTTDVTEFGAPLAATRQEENGQILHEANASEMDIEKEQPHPPDEHTPELDI